MNGGTEGDAARPSLPDELAAIASYEALTGIANELDALLLARERSATTAGERARWRRERDAERARLGGIRPVDIEQVQELLVDWGVRVRTLRSEGSDR